MRSPTLLSLAVGLLVLSAAFWLLERTVISRIVQVLPLYWMGFNAAVLAAFVPFLTL